jgi:hypothetical protein
MSESTAPELGMAPEAALPVPTSQLPCERCGTFMPGDPIRVGTRQVCASCAATLRKELRLYPYVYVLVVGTLFNFCLAGILAGLNWKRLGDKPRARNAFIIAALGVVWMGVLIFLDTAMRGAVILNFIGARVAAQGLDEVYKQHKAAGGTRANLIWPVVYTLGVFVALVLGYTAFLIATDGLPPEEG